MAISNYFVDPDAGDNADDGSVTTPWKTIQYALDNITQNIVHGDQINIKAGTDDVLTAPLSLLTYGTPSFAARLYLKGYTSVANDGGFGGIDGAGSYSMFTTQTWDHISFEDLHLHNSGSSNVIYLDSYINVHNCKVDNTSGSGMYLGYNCMITNCYIYNVGNNGIYAGSYSKIKSCVIEDVGANDISNGLYSGGTSVSILECIVILNTVDARGIRATGVSNLISNNTIYTSVAGTVYGLILGNAWGSTVVQNNYIEGFSGVGGIGIYISTGILEVLRSNRVYNCTTAFNKAGIIVTDIDNSEVGSSALADPSNGDFSVGTDLKAGAYPSTFKGINTDQFVDIGAAQREESVGGVTNIILQGRHNVLLRR